MCVYMYIYMYMYIYIYDMCDYVCVCVNGLVVISSPTR